MVGDGESGVSATGRKLRGTGEASVRHDQDFYETPAWCIRSMLPHVLRGNEKRICDPGCGTGAIGREIVAAVPTAHLIGYEIDHARAATAESFFGAGGEVFVRDFLASEVESGFDLIMANPPYSLALEFIKRSLSLLAPEGRICFLLRLPFLEGQARAPFFREHPPDVYVLPKRPSFTGGGTDATAYAWMMWPGSGRLAWLDVP